MTDFEFTPPATADTLYSGSVTVDIDQVDDAAFTLPSPVTYLADNAAIRYIGGGEMEFGASWPDTFHYTSKSKYPHTHDSQWTFGEKVVHTGTTIQFRHKYLAASTYQIYIDGHPLSEIPEAYPGTTPGWIHTTTLTFPTSGTRTITFMHNSMPFGGLCVGTGQSIANPGTPRMRVVFQGDSITGGSGMNTGDSLGTWAHRFARYSGVDDPWIEAIGGTGYIATGSAVTIGARTATDVTAYSPAAVMLWGGYNDGLETPSNVATACTSVITAYQSGLPSAQVILVGMWSPAGTAATAHVNIDNALKAVALAKGVPFVSPITGQVLDGAGNVVLTAGKWVTPGNVAAMVGSDGVHPTDAGHELIANRMYDAMVALSGTVTTTEVVAYRGSPGSAADTTEEKLTGLALLPGLVNGPQVSVRRSTDGGFFLCEDATFTRTSPTGATGTAATSNSAQFIAAGMTELTDYLDACQDSNYLSVVLRFKMDLTYQMLGAVAILNAHPMRERVLVTTSVAAGETPRWSEIRSAGWIGRLGVEGLTVANWSTYSAAFATYDVEIGFLASGDTAYTTNAALIGTLHTAGYDAGAYNITSAKFSAAVTAGADMVITSDPSGFLASYIPPENPELELGGEGGTMASLTTQSIRPVTGTGVTYSAATSGGGDTVLPNGNKTYIHVKNGSGSAVTVTVAVPGNAFNSQPNPDTAVSVGAGAEKFIPIGPEYADPTTGRATVTYSAVTSVTVAAIGL